MPKDLLPINQAAKLLKVSIDTLRRWDKSGKFLAVRKHPTGNRYYRMTDVELILSNLYQSAEDWCLNKKGVEPSPEFYCSNIAVFQARLASFDRQLTQFTELKKIYSLVVAAVGEVGNNSFDHNLGNWRDIPGIFFGYNLACRQVVLADRGQGILKTLKRVRPELKNDLEALKVSFTEILSGRAPETRGNGLKFVRETITNHKMKLFFQTGNAALYLNHGDKELNINQEVKNIEGCICLINF